MRGVVAMRGTRALARAACKRRAHRRRGLGQCARGREERLRPVILVRIRTTAARNHPRPQHSSYVRFDPLQVTKVLQVRHELGACDLCAVVGACSRQDLCGHVDQLVVNSLGAVHT